MADGKENRAQGSIGIYVFAFLAVLAITIYPTYPNAAKWWNAHLQSQALEANLEIVSIGPQAKLDQIRENAQSYNELLRVGAKPGKYAEQLNPGEDGQMGRVLIPKIDVDLPIYHTSNDDVLRRGAGHMEDTSLPIGGQGSHAAITAHRGLGTSQLFTDLDKIRVGDTFSIEVLGEVLAYRVFQTRVVNPDETKWLLRDDNKDLVTLITCDPLHVNSERMLITGQRISPTPPEAVEETKHIELWPGFPWWAAVWLVGVIVILGFSAHLIRHDNVRKKEQTNA